MIVITFTKPIKFKLVITIPFCSAFKYSTNSREVDTGTAKTDDEVVLITIVQAASTSLLPKKKFIPVV